MTSSPELDNTAAPELENEIDPLPPMLSSMWRLCKFGFAHERRLLISTIVLSQLAALPDALLAFWLMLLSEGVLKHRPALMQVAAIGLAFSASATWLLHIISARLQRRFRDRITIALESHVAQLQASIATVAHQERPEYLDRLSILRNQVFVLDHMYVSLIATLGWALRLGVTIALLTSIHPALVLLFVFAIPTLLSSTWRPGAERAAQEQGAQANRLARHLFVVATTAVAGKEVRVMGIGERLVRDRRAAWERWYDPIAATRRESASWRALTWAVFGFAYVWAVIFVSMRLHAPASSVLLVLAAGSRLSSYVGATAGELGFLRGFWGDGARRLAWLEDYAASAAGAGDLPVPARLRSGIRLDHVSFTYPGTSRLVLDDVSVNLPAGSIVAIVGENGAGKTTLVKLLAKMYEPSSGSIFVDNAPLARFHAAEWRSRLAGAFQDFFRFEFRTRQTVGLGDVPRVDNESAVGAAVQRAGAGDVVSFLPSGFDTQLGRGWPSGVELSFGQWQKLAVARGFMRDEPLLLVLDEPTAALDAETEHVLFERYAEAARSANKSSTGRITVLVSHRFSTVRMADLIIVIVRSRLAEMGTHEALMARHGPYAELYRIQAASYN